MDASKSLKELIDHFSVAALRDFFFQKIASFRAEEEDLNYLCEGAGYEAFDSLTKLGEATLDAEDLLFFSCHYQGELSERSAKKKQYELAKSALKADFKDGAIFVFYDTAGCFRFSFIRRNYSPDAKGDKKYTPYKRYTYFVEVGKANRTFLEQVSKCDFSDLDSIQDAFNLKKLNNEFYKELFSWYLWAKDHVNFPNDTAEDNDKLISESLIRFISRLLFVWFMKEKKLVAQQLFDIKKIKHILNDFDPQSNKNTFYKAILQNLFFATLNVPIQERKWVDGKKKNKAQLGDPLIYRFENEFNNSDEAIKNIFMQIPFLNGGLFDCLDDRPNDIFVDGFTKNEKKQVQMPNFLFFGNYENIDLSHHFDGEKANVKKQWAKQNITGVIDLLNNYNFTVEENTPLEIDVALDPELLGKVFENLLATFNPETKATARNQTGSFYTPREIVNYMVHESLKQHLLTHLPNKEQGINQLFSNEPPTLDDTFKQKAVEKLFDCKILDPACGSGAYPMGILHKMVELMTVLDPENRYLKENEGKKIDKLITDAKTLNDTKIRNQTIEALEKQKAILQNSNYDYVRKLYIIENCIYGVDIQPIAIQISKLRFFISLLVEQNKNEQQQNMGIEPLPNLDFKLVAANTLISPPQEDKNIGLFAAQDEFFNRFEHLAHDYFTLHTPEAKKQKKKELEQLINEKVNEKKIDITREADVGKRATAIENSLKLWKSYTNIFKEKAVAFFDTIYFFPKVKDGFDVVIGNPPYGFRTVLSKDEKQYFRKVRNIEFRSGDSAELFTKICFDELLKNNGLLSFIIPKKSLYGDAWEDTRVNYWKKYDLAFILDTGKSFENVLLEASVFGLKKSKTSKNIKISFLMDERIVDLGKYPFDKLMSEWNTLQVYKAQCLTSITDKIEKVKFKESVVQGKLGLAIGTDFFSDEETNYKLLKGIDIQKYHVRSNRYLTNIKKLNWNNAKEFLKPKVLVQRLVAHIQNPYPHLKITACYDEDGIIITNTLMSFTLDKRIEAKFWLAYLNSKFTSWYAYNFVYARAIRGMDFYNFYIQQIPVPEISVSAQQPFIELVDTILSKKAASEDTATEEATIDHMVYALYGLTEEEIAVVERGYL